MGWRFSGFVLSLGLASVLFASHCPSRLIQLGSHFDPTTQKIRFGLVSRHAERVELLLFDSPHGPPIRTIEMSKSSEGKWFTEVDHRNPSMRLYYGYRLWGPNWRYSPKWVPGSEEGFLSDVDAHGNHFNPNKLVLDPYAQEVSHDPLSPAFHDHTVYLTGDGFRAIDSGLAAPKGIVFAGAIPKTPSAIERPFKEEIIYEVHLRGFTRGDASIPESERGTYRGAARKAAYLSSLGVTAVEFLPIHESQNDLNSEDSTAGNNYWGYMTLNYFAPDRRYATKESARVPGGVTREFQDMVKAFHDVGIKVYLDVVYNHTGEGHASILSFRGIDNQAYYQTSGPNYKDNNGCGPNFNCAHKVVRDLIIDSLKHYRDLGVDGFRFDLASVLGNTHSEGLHFSYDKMKEHSVLNRAIVELPARSAKGGRGVELIAEPWAVNDDSYQQGHFPYHPEREAGWAEWNGKYRDDVRSSINRSGFGSPTPGQLAKRLAGSIDHFGDDGRKPWHSVNFITSHDGFTLWDLVSYNHPVNGQGPPYGPSDGGEPHNLAWDQTLPGDTVELTQSRRRTAARTAMALNLLSLGTPMILGGDEFLRSQNGNNNAWNVDSKGSWLSWDHAPQQKAFTAFTRSAIAFRKGHPELRPAEFLHGDSLKWYQADGSSAEGSHYMDNAQNTFLGYLVGGSTYIAYSWGFRPTHVTLPKAKPGKQWYRAADTHSTQEFWGNWAAAGNEERLSSSTYPLQGRSLAVFIEK
jgi:isoamylase